VRRPPHYLRTLLALLLDTLNQRRQLLCTHHRSRSVGEGRGRESWFAVEIEQGPHARWQGQCGEEAAVNALTAGNAQEGIAGSHFPHGYQCQSRSIWQVFALQKCAL